ncbi:MAG: phosphoribosylformylglycinamidine synthase [Clostridiales bacterium 38-18]|nr:MAG: phosphoribosylformylglycinamidine synthase [Clostridiales bacterium 38-18]
MVTRVLVEKKKGFDVEAIALAGELKHDLHLSGLKSVRIINCYDFEGVPEDKLETVINTVLSEPNVDQIRLSDIKIESDETAFRYSLLPGQYDQRADSAAQCIGIVTLENRAEIAASKIIVLKGTLSEEEVLRVKAFLINPVESSEVALERPIKIALEMPIPQPVETVKDFIKLSNESLSNFRNQMGFAMTLADLEHIQNYFIAEKRNPTITELKVIDTYWSDHCRHTTFMTELTDVTIEASEYTTPIVKAYESYLKMRESIYGNSGRLMTLMDLATINMKTLRKNGGLEDLDVSDEINACSIKIDVDVNGIDEPWLLMFKNETHNHPTEIEPYGGAATCLGGAIRDPLSGRSYVYQSMRVTGAGNPLTPIEETLEGKLPQKIITQKAAAGFSAYGNQIGLATGHVAEVYDDGFVAKRMEVGAVMGAAPLSNVRREQPETGDLIVLIGGRTGRDGVGGATGSSKAHDEESLVACGAEVQKGNAPEERKIQRLFRNPKMSACIKKCNDFGAGGVSVAIGELADSLKINLDKVPKKYEGLDGTELAISESQERMAVVIAPEDLDQVMSLCDSENLEATVVAEVTDTGRLEMTWQGQSILDVSRAFLDTNGVRGSNQVNITAPKATSYFDNSFNGDVVSTWLNKLSSLNVCSQKGLVERFDNTIGAATVLMPFGGVNQLTPSQAMAAKLPVLGGETNTVSMMSYGYQSEIGKWSPFHGGVYSVVESIAKLVAIGGDYKKIRLSLQEYFEKLGTDPVKWGKPMAALLGACDAQVNFNTAAIGGKDSMSGTFKDRDVPPTLISFAVTYGKTNDVISQELKNKNSKLVLFNPSREAADMPNYTALKSGYDVILSEMHSGNVLSAYAIGEGGVAMALSKMAFGNQIGFKLESKIQSTVFSPEIGSIVIEVSNDSVGRITNNADFSLIGQTQAAFEFTVGDAVISGKDALKAWTGTLEPIFPTQHHDTGVAKTISYTVRSNRKPAIQIAKPRVFVPVFPGTNCEYDTIKAFEKAGATVEFEIFRNLTPEAVKESVERFAEKIKKSQIVALPGGFSAGDEPEGSGKFIASVFRNPKLAEEIMALLNSRDGMMLGICNGFQALVKLGLLPYGEIRELSEDSPTLTFNKIGRHVARMASVRVASVNSPWLSNANVGEIYQTAFSHGEGRFFADEKTIQILESNGQIATQYVDSNGQATYDGNYNINGSVEAIEGVFSPDGRVFGKMGHIERTAEGLYKNIYGEKTFDIFQSGVSYFK